MYFLEEENKNFPFGTRRNFLRSPPPPSSGAKRGSRHRYEHSFYYLPVNVSNTM